MLDAGEQGSGSGSQLIQRGVLFLKALKGPFIQ